MAGAGPDDIQRRFAAAIAGGDWDLARGHFDRGEARAAAELAE
jgi:hypothetical protein